MQTSMCSEISDRVESSVRRVLVDDFPSDFACTAEEGQITLTGTAKNKDDATTCGVIARMVPGVRQVINNLRAE